ncbi:MAG: tetratricopeptide repeat protein [Sedimentisphaerales bacterium]
MKKNIKTIIIFAVSLIIAADCQGGHKQKKQEMETKWQRTSLEMKLSAAMSQFDSGQYDGAEAIAKECIASDYNLPDAYLLLGKLRLVQGNFSDAEINLEKYMNLKSNSDEGAFSLGLACEHLNDNASALRWYQKALELSPQNTDYIIALGRLLTAQGKFVEAENLYQQKMAVNSTDIDLKIAAGQMYLEWGQKDKAVAIYEQAQLARPDDVELLEAAGSCYILAEKWQKAHDTHKQLYKLCTDSNRKNGYLKIMAFAATQAGDYSSALKYYSHLTLFEKKNPQLWILMGQAALGADLPQQAISCSKKALAISPDLAGAYLLSGSANYVSGNYSKAIDDFHRAAIDPALTQFAWLMSARCYEKMGYVEQAKAAYEKASQFQSDSELQQLLVKSNAVRHPQADSEK